MTLVRIAALLLVGAFGTAAVACRDPFEQIIAVSLVGLSLVLLFLVWMAPDVALAQAVAGGLPYPLMILLALARIRRRQREDASNEGCEEGP